MYLLANDIRQGYVNLPLENAQGITIATHDGEGIITKTPLLHSEAYADQKAKEAEDRILTGLIKEEIALGTTTKDGQEIANESGQIIATWREI